MPRKPSIQRQPLRIGANAESRKRVGRASWGRTYYQCINCGAPVDAMLVGDGSNNWCPSCHTSGDVMCEIGHLPDPPLYGQWLRSQEEKHPITPGTTTVPVPMCQPATLNGESPMKTPKTHTGTYSCLDCYIEFDLVAEPSLKCDQCEGPLSRGSLEQLTGEELDEDD